MPSWVEHEKSFIALDTDIIYMRNSYTMTCQSMYVELMHEF